MTDIITRDGWGARDGGGSPRDLSQITRAHLHYTTGRALGRDAADSSAWVRNIQAWHQDNNGWQDIGYHFLVDRYGQVFEGRTLDVIGAHVAGHNTGSVGIAVLGGELDDLTPACGNAILDLLDQVEDEVGNELEVRLHRDDGATHCPGDTIAGWHRDGRPRREVADETGADEGGTDDGTANSDGYVLRMGDKGARVRRWQQALMDAGFDLPRFGADGDFGPETRNATLAFYDAVGLVAGDRADPGVGPRSRAALDAYDPGFTFAHDSQIRRGSTGAAVREWQQALRRWDSRALPRFGPDGDFGDETADWTGRFMVDVGLVSSAPANPIVGNRTRTAAERSLG